MRGIYLGARYCCPIRIAYIKILKPQPRNRTPFDTYKSTAHGILTSNMRSKISKAFDMRYWWIKDRIKQNTFDLIWAAGKQNAADYFTKHHPQWHLKKCEHVLAKISAPCHTPNQQIFLICEQCERVCYSRNSRAFDTQTIPESYVTLNPISQFHNRYMTVNIVSPFALQNPVQNSTPLCYRYTTVMLPLTSYLGLKQLMPYRLS